MTCRELIRFLDAYLAEELPPGVRRAFEGHLEACVECRDYLRGYRRTVALVRDAWAAGEPTCGDVPDELFRVVREAQRAGPGGRS